MSGFAWSIGSWLNQAVKDALHPALCGAHERDWSAEVWPLWLVFAAGLVFALFGFWLAKRVGRCLGKVKIGALGGGLVQADLLSGVGGFIGDEAAELGGRLRDLWRKALVWAPTLSFDEAMRASLGAAGLAYGGLLYALLVTLLAALLVIAIEAEVRRRLRAARANGSQAQVALAHDLSNLMSNAFGAIVGYSWGAFTSAQLSPTMAGDLTGLLAFAVISTAISISVSVWLAERFPKLQAKLIYDPGAVQRQGSRRPMRRGGSEQEMQEQTQRA
jgi:hypothetical protein